MKNKLSLCAAMLIASLFLLTAFKDEDWLTNLLSKFDNLRKEYPQEKVHLQLDKPYYSIGDDVWFKAYIVNSENNELSALSKILYVDLVDEQDSTRKTLVLPIVNGLTNGDIKLNDSLVNPGVYHIKAYTRWMQNFDKSFLFNKELIIGDARTPTSVIGDARFTFEQGKLTANITYTTLNNRSTLFAKPVSYTLLYKDKVIESGRALTDDAGKININLSYKDQYKASEVYLKTVISVQENNKVTRTFAVYNPAAKTDVQFFAEGGKLVNGIRSKIAFKAIGPDGLGENIKGTVVNQNNQPVADLLSAHAGMGIFALQPVAGATYTAVITDELGVQNRYPLPLAENEGYVLSINHTANDSITIRVAGSEASLQKDVALVAQQNGVVRYATKVKLDKAAVSTRLAEIKFNTGIVQFTLLSSDGYPLAERLLFVNHQDQLKLNISTNKPAYSKREKVSMQLKVTDDENKPVEGNFSVAVTDAGKVQLDENEENTILSNLLLTSDLKGFIEKPNYYFTNINADKIRQLDNLLLTQGWRRFSWADIKENKIPAVLYKPQESIEVSGKITTLTGKPVPNGKVTLLAKTLQGQLIVDTTADANGNFLIDKLDIAGDVNVIVKARNAKNYTGVKITLNPVAKLAYKSPFASRDELSTTIKLLNYLKSTQARFDKLDNGMLNKTIMLQEVNVNAKKFVDKFYVANSKKLGGGQADYVIKKEKLTNKIRLIDAFYGIAGIEVKGGMVYRVGHVSSLTRSNGVPMQVMLNGQPIDQGILSEITPADVEGIELITSGSGTAIYGNDGVWGVIEVTMKAGGGDGYRFTQNIGRMKVNGLTPQREFYSPAYDVADDKNKETDLRSTIFWTPNVVTDAKGDATLSYFTGDEPGSYRVVAEGLNVDGKLARQVFTFIVK